VVTRARRGAAGPDDHAVDDVAIMVVELLP
jgi:hypothetical protein